MKKRLLTGIKPTGDLHLGNYFGAFKKTIDFVENDSYESYVFIANLHALNSGPESKLLKKRTYDLVLDLLSLGLNPDKCVFFLQSDVSAHTELTWLLLNQANMGFLERAHAFKDAIDNKGVARNEVNVGLFMYPVLMAADILIYAPDIVPVGKDQKQHIEIARDLAQKMNAMYGCDIKLPEAMIEKEMSVIQGIDGRKMSKSYDNYIPVFENDENKGLIKKRIMSIETDSKDLDEIKDPLTCNVFKIYELLATKSEVENMRDNYLAGGYGYGHAKKELLRVYTEYFKEANERRLRLLSKGSNIVNDVLSESSIKANAEANVFLRNLYEKIGLTY
jgi:tryptophanyl-tRNA synthetase